MGNPLTVRTPLRELAERGQVIDTEDVLSVFGRLVEVLEDQFRSSACDDIPANWRRLPVTIKLRFHWADSLRKYPAAEGEVTAVVPLVCQRCLEPFEQELRVPLKLLLDVAGEAVSGESDYEVWELDEDTLRPLDVAEEALIMALPLVAMHDGDTNCAASVDAEQEQDKDAELTRPFADLRSQMKQTD
jgi:uncharacterized metal-binding protein YceD (DUF177 family)